MVKRLKIKFIIVIMMIVTLLLGSVFISIMILTHNNIERDSIRMMQTLLFEKEKTPPFFPPDKDVDKKVMPFFKLTISKENEITADGGGYYDLSDEKMLETLFKLADSEEKQIGVLKEYNLRFCKADTDDGCRIVFADMSAEKGMLKEFAKNTLIIGAAAFILFFIISILLAVWVTGPVEKTLNDQKQFIADASHELKTPLTVIITNAEMLCDSVYSEENKKEFRRNILSMSQRMRGLVESLLELARMDCSVSENFENTDFSCLVSDCILPFEPLFFEKSVELTCSIKNGIRVKGDTGQLRQLTEILLDNALKYSDSESTVEVKLDSSSDNCVLSVSSEGNTLSDSDCQKIFRRFYRADKSRGDGGSYGLGLSIADSIVKKHGGKIWAENREGKNIFYVSMKI